MLRRRMGRLVAGLVFFVVATGALSLVTMLLWNALVPSLFRGPSVTFVQAVGLLLLSHILLRGGGPWRHRYGWRHQGWRGRLEEKLRAMPPEERERFREEWLRRCGWAPRAPGAPVDDKPAGQGTT